MSQNRFLVKADRRLIVKCSLSTEGPVHFLKSPKCLTRSTNPIICPSRHLYFQTLCWILVRTRPRSAGHKLTTLDAYDVNVSPDKRTILLHDQQALLENLRVCVAFAVSLSF